MGQIERFIRQPVAGSLLLLCLILCAVLAVVAVRASRRRVADRAAMRAALAEARAVRRLLGQVRGDLRNAALAVHGHADRLRSGAPPGSEAAAQAGSVILLAARMLTLAEDAGDATAETGDSGAGHAGAGNGVARRPPALDTAWLPLADLLADAIAATTAGLGPAGRVWRIGPAVRDWAVLGDRRALQAVLSRVLVNAVCSSRDGDWIEIDAVREGEWLVVGVEDEGAGLAGADSPGAGSRGLGLGLSRAGDLMAAHGGRLDIDSVARVGTRVRLAFPPTRVRAAL